MLLVLGGNIDNCMSKRRKSKDKIQAQETTKAKGVIKQCSRISSIRSLGRKKQRKNPTSQTGNTTTYILETNKTTVWIFRIYPSISLPLHIFLCQPRPPASFHFHIFTPLHHCPCNPARHLANVLLQYSILCTTITSHREAAMSPSQIGWGGKSKEKRIVVWPGLPRLTPNLAPPKPSYPKQASRITPKEKTKEERKKKTQRQTCTFVPNLSRCRSHACPRCNMQPKNQAETTPTRGKKYSERLIAALLASQLLFFIALFAFSPPKVVL